MTFTFVEVNSTAWSFFGKRPTTPLVILISRESAHSFESSCPGIHSRVFQWRVHIGSRSELRMSARSFHWPHHPIQTLGHFRKDYISSGPESKTILFVTGTPGRVPKGTRHRPFCGPAPQVSSPLSTTALSSWAHVITSGSSSLLVLFPSKSCNRPEMFSNYCSSPQRLFSLNTYLVSPSWTLCGALIIVIRL